MGTTKTAMQAGSVATAYVVAIEGYEFLLTDYGSAAAVATAWAATEWSSSANVLPGCAFVDLKNTLQLHPWEPFQPGGTCQIAVVGETGSTGERFAIDVAKTAAGVQTGITSSVTRTTTTINVERTADFPASGDAFIGHERFRYTSTTATSFVVSVRGLYSPFAQTEADITHFPRRASVGVPDQYSTSALPVVTSVRHDWVGAWVGVWEHRVVNGVLDTRAEAQLVFAGQIDSTKESENGATLINLRHVLDIAGNTTVFLDQYSARIADTCYVGVNDYLIAFDTGPGGNNSLLRVDTVASLPYTIAAGRYTVDQLIGYLNAALAALTALAAGGGPGGLTGTHSFSSDGAQIYDTHTFAAAATGTTSGVVIQGRGAWIAYLGGTPAPAGGAGQHDLIARSVVGPAEYTFTTGPIFPIRIFSDEPSAAIQVLDEQGVFIDNAGSGGTLLPAAYSSYWDGTNQLGFFLVDGKTLICGRISGGFLLDARWITDYQTPLPLPSGFGPSVTGTSIKQVFIITRAWWVMLTWFFVSTGDTGFNDPSYDVLPYGLGLELPYELIGGPTGLAPFISDALTMPASGFEATVWITKPTKLVEILTVDLALRTTYPVWKDNSLRLATWQSPVASLATMVLVDGNKAEPANSMTPHLTPLSRDGSYAKPIVKVQFDYDPVADKFSGPGVVLYDRVAIASGSKDPITLSWKSAGQGDHAAGLVQAIMPAFTVVWQKFFSAPWSVARRSIDMRYYEGYAPGDIVLFDDPQVRDPSTGLRGTSARPGLVLRHTYAPGGARLGSGEPEPPVGEVDILVLPRNLDTIWSPAAEVDETANTGGFTAGYNSGTSTMRTKSHVHSESSEQLDAFNFAAGDVVWITELDPAIATAPDRWTRTIAPGGVVGGDITFTAALASPAFSSTKRYRITSVDYANATATQKADAYQADDADGMIENLAPSYNYGIAGAGLSPTLLTHVELCELDPTGVSAGDGVPFDTGFHLGLVKSANNLIDHKTAVQGAALSSNIMVYAGSSTYRLVELRRRYFGAAQTNFVHRALAVAPWLRSTSGTSTVRVTLTRAKPFVNTAGAAVFSAFSAQKTFTSSSATWATAAEQLLDLGYCDATGVCWIAIEVSANAQTRGLAQCIVRERT